MKRALITGIHGQDGSYLAEYLSSLGYDVFGMTRRVIPTAWERPATLIYGDMRDALSIEAAIRKAWPDEIYNLAGQVSVPVSWEHPELTHDVNTSGLERILKIVSRIKSNTKVYQANSSEMFGNVNGACDEHTPLNPMSPYGVSKAAAHRLCELYRARDLFVVSGMLFNHESPRRGHEMVTRKIARHVALWASGSEEVLKLGNIESRRDWGFALDYVKAMHKMLQQPTAEDFVIGTGVSHSVKDFVLAACTVASIDPDFALSHVIAHDEQLSRTQEIHNLIANPSKAHEVLHWEAETSFFALVKIMVQAEVDALANKLQQEFSV